MCLYVYVYMYIYIYIYIYIGICISLYLYFKMVVRHMKSNGGFQHINRYNDKILELVFLILMIH